MNNKILLGSIIAVVILVLVSFTGVVGYQTTNSSTIGRVSPLFSVRSKRAIGQGQKDITTDYLGREEETNIHLTSRRIRRTEQVQKIIDIISKMSDKSFRKVVARIILNLKNQEQMTDIETSDVLKILYNIRRNPNDMKYYNTENIPTETLQYITCFGNPNFCLINTIRFILAIMWLAIIGWILNTTGMGCNTMQCPL